MTTYGWALRRIAEPESEPVTLAEAKAQCQIDADITDQNSRLTAYIKAARQLAEQYMKASIMEQRWRLTLDRFPGCADDYQILLRMGPILVIDSVKYYDTDGTLQTLTEGTGYQTNLDDEPPTLMPPIDGYWPTTQVRANAVQIEYSAGYPSTGSPAGADGVPQPVHEAILSRVASMYHQREDVVYAAQHSPDTFGFERSLDPYRRYP